MIFTSIAFLIFFVVLLAMFGVVRGQQGRIHLLLAASYFFYGFWNVKYLALIGFASLFSWWIALKIEAAVDDRQRKRLVQLSVIVSLAILGYFKYTNFFLESVTNLLGLNVELFSILLPVGISFYIFQTMSYTIDVYRRHLTATPHLEKYLLYVAFFPQLVAGPIVRAKDFLPQLDRPIVLTRENFIIGSQIFLGGALQKVILADNLSTFVDPVFAAPDFYSAGTLWLALFAYSLQIFCDFCGYSLMAIGIARIFGFELMENFRMPYNSRSITEFWRRWHMSLSFWLRDYLYISLGGNRRGELRARMNLVITMLLGGLWHGASWNFVLWGALHGVALVVHKYWAGTVSVPRDALWYRLLAWGLTFVFVSLCWLPFRSPDFDTTSLYLSRMFGLESGGVVWMNPYVLMLMAVAVVWHVLYAVNSGWLTQWPRRQIGRVGDLTLIGAALLLIALTAPLNTSPFIYFQF